MSIGLTLLFLTLLHLYYGVLALKFVTGAGYKSWQALLPFYNVYIMTKVIHRPWWWTILAVLPVVGNVMMVVIFFELMHMYRIANILNTILGVITFGIYFGYLGYTSKLKYQDRDIKIIRKYISEGFASIVFAVVAATLIRAYTFEAFVIPTPSMEKSMLVGDFLFVSKLQYGSRLPMTPFSMPLMHNRVPFTEVKSFTDIVTFPYLRLPKISDVKRNDPVVFNYPMEDHYPVDKREHYVKRCVALPGDLMEIRNGNILIDGEESPMPAGVQKQGQYFVRTKGQLSTSKFKETYNVNTDPAAGEFTFIGFNATNGNSSHPDIKPNHYEYVVNLSDSQYVAFQELANIDTLFPMDLKANLKGLPLSLQNFYNQTSYVNAENPQERGVFPHMPALKWTRDNYGPLRIPAAGASIDLTVNNYAFYKRIIEVYEGHSFKMVAPSAGSLQHRFLIDGEERDSYTFEQDYYWMMGDNRHNSLDSRFWGFVPADHIVGKPVFIWMSFDKYAESWADKIRFDRVFTTVSNNGKRFSYFWPFVIVVVGISLFNRWRQKKAGAAKS